MTKYKFQDIVLEREGFLRGPFGSALKKSLFIPKNEKAYKVYEQSVVLEENKDLGSYYISEEYFNNELQRFEVKENDFLVSCSGVNYGAIYQLKGKIEKGVINQALLRIRLNNDLVDDNYFYYYFKAYIVKKITGGTGDSTIPNFPPMSYVKNIELELPDLEQQKIIGRRLKDIDDKILNNKNIISELELMAKTIYDYWFLQYDYPDAKGKPYKSNGGNMVYNEELKKEIPEGWKVGTIRDIIIEKGKSSIQVGEAKDKSGEYPFFTSGSEIYEVDEFITEGRNCYLSTGGKGYIQYYVGKSSYSTDTWVISGKDNLEDYLYLFIKSIEDMLDIKYFAGTGLKHLQKDLFKDTHIAIPNEETLKMFNEISNKMFNKISRIYKENQELIKLREDLLPLLMNGQVGFRNQ